VDKHIERPVFQHELSLNKSLEQLHVELLNLRHLGYQVELRRNIYNEELFKITGFAGTVFEIDGVAAELNSEQSQIHYNAHIDKHEFGNWERLRSIVSVFVYAGLCSFIYSTRLYAPSLLPVLSLMIVIVWLLVARSLYLVLKKDPYQDENEIALRALLKLESNFLASMNSDFTAEENQQLLHRHKVEREDAEAN
jgi:hypothetical protein